MRTSRSSSPIAPPSTSPTRASTPPPKSAPASPTAPTASTAPARAQDTYNAKPQGGPSTATVSGPSANTVKEQENGRIRAWYNQQVSTIPAMDAKMKAAGASAEERARAACKVRHDARLEARRMMSDPREVEDLRKRDQQVYGNPDGPTFDQLVNKAKAKGLEGEAVYESIIGSSNRTNAEVNARFEQGGAQAPADKSRL